MVDSRPTVKVCKPAGKGSRGGDQQQAEDHRGGQRRPLGDHDHAVIVIGGGLAGDAAGEPGKEQLQQLADNVADANHQQDQQGGIVRQGLKGTLQVGRQPAEQHRVEQFTLHALTQVGAVGGFFDSAAGRLLLPQFLVHYFQAPVKE